MHGVPGCRPARRQAAVSFRAASWVRDAGANAAPRGAAAQVSARQSIRRNRGAELDQQGVRLWDGAARRRTRIPPRVVSCGGASQGTALFSPGIRRRLSLLKCVFVDGDGETTRVGVGGVHKPYHTAEAGHLANASGRLAQREREPHLETGVDRHVVVCAEQRAGRRNVAGFRLAPFARPRRAGSERSDPTGIWAHASTSPKSNGHTISARRVCSDGLDAGTFACRRVT